VIWQESAYCHTQFRRAELVCYLINELDCKPSKKSMSRHLRRHRSARIDQRPGADPAPGRPAARARREALHLTLNLIGDVPEAVARAYQRTLAQVEAPAFELRIAGVGQFPIEARPGRTRWKQLLRLVNQESPRSNQKF